MRAWLEYSENGGNTGNTRQAGENLRTSFLSTFSIRSVVENFPPGPSYQLRILESNRTLNIQIFTGGYDTSNFQALPIVTLSYDDALSQTRENTNIVVRITGLSVL